MSYYPYYRSLYKNVKQTMVPLVSSKVYVYSDTGGGLIPIFSSSTGTNELTQPILSDKDGSVFFYVAPGRIRLDIDLDGVNTFSIQDTVADTDNIVLPYVGEVPVGTIDGVNVTFTLANVPHPTRTAVYVDGKRFSFSYSAPAPSQFTISSTTLTLGSPPVSSIVVDYWTV
jgi:hypothetical protein